jgi:N-acetylneuraminate synthase
MPFPFDSKKVQVIAEACDNHMGCIDTAFEMCRLAKLAGADFIKFQHHLADEEMLAETPMSDNFDEPLYDFLKKNALSLENHIRLKKFCEEIGINYLCTPFSAKAAEELAGIGVTMFKIGSGELRDLPTLKKISKLGLPMILSTGMSTLDEIKDTAQFLNDQGAEFSFLNCVSEYPPKYEEMNIAFITILKESFPDLIIGHSDHSPDLYTTFAAVALGARIVEKHVILDKKTPGPDQSVSINFHELAQLVDGVRKIELSLGSSKIIQPKEIAIREWAYRSVIAVRDMAAGTILKETDLTTKRPGTGIPATELFNLVGKELKRSVKGNSMLVWEDLTL